MELSEFVELDDVPEHQLPDHVKTLADFVAWNSRFGRSGRSGGYSHLAESKKQLGRTSYETRHGEPPSVAEERMHAMACQTDEDIDEMVSGMNRDDAIDYIWDVLKECRE